MSHQVDDVLSPCGAGLGVRADENVVVPSLESVDEVSGGLFLKVWVIHHYEVTA